MEVSCYNEQLSNSRRACPSSALAAFQFLNALFVSGRDSRKIADEVGVPTKDPVMFFHRLRQTLHVHREQLQTLSQRFMSFGQPVEAFVSSHANIVPAFRFKKNHAPQSP